MEGVTDIQSRADIISMIACSGLLLNAFSEQDIAARDRDPVALVGFALREPLIASTVGPTAADALRWVADTIIRNTPATSVHVFQGERVLCQAGVISSDPSKGVLQLMQKRPILNGVLETGEEVYCPDLQILPGKIEFTYIPMNCQSLLILPAKDLAVVVGSNQAKVFKLDDLTRIRTVVDLLKSQSAI
jgi:hypothetical protein